MMGMDAKAGQLAAVVAMTPDGIIGLNGELPWRLGSDLRRFKRLTMGGVLLMGRLTYDSIGRPLPGRRTIVISRNPNWSAEGVESATTPEGAVEMGRQGDSPLFVVGGAEIYRQLLPKCTRLYLTRVWSGVQGDTKLSIDLSEFELIEQTRLPATARDEVPSEFWRLIRRES